MQGGGNVMLDVHHEKSRLDGWLPPSLSLLTAGFPLLSLSGSAFFSSTILTDELDLS